MVGPVTTVIAYVFGSIPFGYLIVRWKRGIDIRSTGRGGTGATNVMRNLGLPGFLATAVLDFSKGVAAVIAASRLTHGDARWIAAAAVAAVAGHIFPVWLQFRGGKGIATGVGVFAALAPIPLGISLLLFACVFAVWRYVSLGSIVATGSFPVTFYLLEHPPTPLLVSAILAAALIIARHHADFARLWKGRELKSGKEGTRSKT